MPPIMNPILKKDNGQKRKFNLSKQENVALSTSYPEEIVGKL